MVPAVHELANEGDKGLALVSESFQASGRARSAGRHLPDLGSVGRQLHAAGLPDLLWVRRRDAERPRPAPSADPLRDAAFGRFVIFQMPTPDPAAWVPAVTVPRPSDPPTSAPSAAP